MWTEELADCPGCGAILRMISNGRCAYVEVAELYDLGDQRGNTPPAWREGIVVRTSCPVIRFRTDDPCGETVTFIGEGRGLSTAHETRTAFAVPILMEVP